MNTNFFEKEISSGNARTGVIRTAHGEIKTPVFMPVGTAGTVKGVFPETLKQIGSQIILGNTYHLHLRPGEKIVNEAGGLHKFMNWDKPILTDSGGFQVFSLGKINKISEEGVNFNSHIDGSKLMLTPEISIEIQTKLGSDIVMAFDECAPFPSEKSYIKNSLELTLRWLKRCLLKNKELSKLNELQNNSSALFSIVQGGMFKDLRKESARRSLEFDLPGIAIGGLSVGEPKEMFSEILNETVKYLPENKPRYVMGIGTPDYIFEAISAGIDMFDCVTPTREARHGRAFTEFGPMNIKASSLKSDYGPIDETCDCSVCKSYSRSYLRHLFNSGELLGIMLLSIHNLRFLLRLTENIRESIETNTFLKFKQSFLDKYY